MREKNRSPPKVVLTPQATLRVLSPLLLLSAEEAKFGMRFGGSAAEGGGATGGERPTAVGPGRFAGVYGPPPLCPQPVAPKALVTHATMTAEQTHQP